MSFETLQTVCQILIFVGAGVAGIGGVGVWYFGERAGTEKDEAAKVERVQLDGKIDALLARAETAESKQSEISERLKPFELLAQRKYPDTPDALGKLQNDLTKVDKRTEALENAQRARNIDQALLTRQLAAHLGTRARVAFWEGDPEVAALAAQLLASLSAAGWDSKPHIWMAGGTSGMQGVAIQVLKGNEGTAQALQAALEKCGLPGVEMASASKLGDIYGDAQLILLVGSKPLAQR